MEEVFPLWYEIVPAWELHGFVFSPELLEEYYFFLLKIKSILLRETIIFFSEFCIEGFYFCEDIADGVFHIEDISCQSLQPPLHDAILDLRVYILFQTLGLSCLPHLASRSSRRACQGQPQSQLSQKHEPPETRGT